MLNAVSTLVFLRMITEIAEPLQVETLKTGNWAQMLEYHKSALSKVEYEYKGEW